MLRIAQQMNAKSARRWYATADYYSQGRGIVGSWGGKAAYRLGLGGIVDRSSFGGLCDNLEPRTGKRLTVRTCSRRTVGYDFTFSVPKSVSLLYGMSGDQDILDAVRAAVDESMREMEAEMKTRVRKARQDEDRTTGNMAWAEFVHTASCPVGGVCDPQLHVYIFVFNMTWDQEEERWKAGSFWHLKRDAPYFEAAFRVRLANKLQELGFGVVRKGKDFEIAGIPPGVLRRFSRRTALIEKMARERGITRATWKAELGPKLRERKGAACGVETLREEWNTRLTDQERQMLASVYGRETRYPRQVNGEAWAVDHAIERCFVVHEALVPERKLVAEALQHGMGTVTVESVTRELGKRPLVWSEFRGRKMAILKA
jgi:conjugative relaxase-like TrwC/TraI family protein